MYQLPSYLCDSYYAQKYEAAILAGQSISEPLPSHFMDDKGVPPVISVSADRMEVKFVGTNSLRLLHDSSRLTRAGPVKGSGSDSDAASVRANHPIPSSTGLFYYEAMVLSRGRDGFIGVGFCREDVLLTRLPGWEDDSWGYHGDDGHSFCCQGTGQEYGPKFTTGDVIGCAINFASGECFYTKNGVHLGVAFTGLTGDLYPSIGLKTIGEQVRVNFGAQPFVFDIDYYYRQEKMRLYDSVREEEDDVSSRVQSLVRAYLSHNGYVDSARAMAVDISTQTDQAVNYPPIDMEASNRQRIRSSVMVGDMDSALEMLEQLFPEVLQKDEHLHFQLRCRKFIEMMRLCAESQVQADVAFSESQESEDAAFVQNVQSNLDISMEDVSTPLKRDKHGNSNGNGLKRDSKALLDEAILYGQQLQALYANQTNPIFRARLEDVFSLVAYSDPLSSPVAHLLMPSLRVEIAEDINRAILVSSGKSARSELEEIVASVGTKIGGVKGAEFVNVQRDFLRDCEESC